MAWLRRRFGCRLSCWCYIFLGFHCAVRSNVSSLGGSALLDFAPTFYFLDKTYKMSSLVTASLNAAIPALTTTFTPPSPCLSDYYHYSSNPSNIYQFLGPPQSSTCYPPGWASASQWFSPGICPSGYRIAALTAVTIAPLTETQAVCCPNSYTYALVTTQNGCYRNYAPGFSVFTLTTIAANSSAGSAETSVFVSTFTTHSAINAFGVSIRYQARDFSVPTLTSSSVPRGDEF